MTDMMGMMKQAQAMQAKMQEMQAELERIEVEGQSGGGMVNVTLTAKGEMKASPSIRSLLTAGEKEMLEDLIVAAHDERARRPSARWKRRCSR